MQEAQPTGLPLCQGRRVICKGRNTVLPVTFTIVSIISKRKIPQAFNVIMEKVIYLNYEH